jgi:hypothetical protein
MRYNTLNKQIAKVREMIADGSASPIACIAQLAGVDIPSPTPTSGVQACAPLTPWCRWKCVVPSPTLLTSPHLLPLPYPHTPQPLCQAETTTAHAELQQQHTELQQQHAKLLKEYAELEKSSIVVTTKLEALQDTYNELKETQNKAFEDGFARGFAAAKGA